MLVAEIIKYQHVVSYVYCFSVIHNQYSTNYFIILGFNWVFDA